MRGLLALLVVLLGVATPAAAEELRVPLPDGTSLTAELTSADGKPRPVLVEFSPYGPGTQTFDPGDGYNRLLVQIRGTGTSGGQFDALGPKTQSDVVETLRWACAQPWSDGRLALNGFSASAITVYNSLWQELPCVKAAVLGSGTFELYRDLLVPGGISNLIPGAVVLFGIGAASGPDGLQGAIESGLSYLQHPTLDDWWRERGFRGDVNDLPILMVGGFFDVESRGAFEAFRALKRDGAHLVVTGAHEGAVGGTDGGHAKKVRWLDRYVKGVRNGVAREPRVQLWMADGDREALTAGHFVKRVGRDWPLRRTRWRPFVLGTDRVMGRRATSSARQTYPAVASVPTMTDPPNAGILGGAGLDALTSGFAPLGDMTLVEGLGARWTTKPLKRDWVAAGPASLEVTLSSTSPETAIWAVVSDVDPDGVPHPVASGRLSTAFPGVIRSKSLKRRGEIVQPYGDYSARAPSTAAREYKVELWPVGNRFKAGHRIRLHLVGASLASPLVPPGINTVHAGRLLFPRIP